MPDIHAAFHDSLRRQLAAGNCVAPIVDCIGKMRSEGLADNQIAGLFRHAADELTRALRAQPRKGVQVRHETTRAVLRLTTAAGSGD
jgi:hypothetical protein